MTVITGGAGHLDRGGGAGSHRSKRWRFGPLRLASTGGPGEGRVHLAAPHPAFVCLRCVACARTLSLLFLVSRNSHPSGARGPVADFPGHFSMRAFHALAHTSMDAGFRSFPPPSRRLSSPLPFSVPHFDSNLLFHPSSSPSLLDRLHATRCSALPAVISAFNTSFSFSLFCSIT